MMKMKKSMNNRLSKLEYATITRIIQSNPFFKFKHQNPAISLLSAVEQTLISISKLNEVCQYLDEETQQQVIELRKYTKQLQDKIQEFDQINSEIKVTTLSHSAPKPWFNNK
jgi:hypothetical protein